MILPGDKVITAIGPQDNIKDSEEDTKKYYKYLDILFPKEAERIIQCPFCNFKSELQTIDGKPYGLDYQIGDTGGGSCFFAKCPECDNIMQAEEITLKIYLTGKTFGDLAGKMKEFLEENK